MEALPEHADEEAAAAAQLRSPSTACLARGPGDPPWQARAWRVARTQTPAARALLPRHRRAAGHPVGTRVGRHGLVSHALCAPAFPSSVPRLDSGRRDRGPDACANSAGTSASSHGWLMLSPGRGPCSRPEGPGALYCEL